MSLSQGKAGATIAVSDLDRARSFYEEKLGLSPQQDMSGEEGGAVVYGAGSGTEILVYTSQYAGTNQATAVSFDVADLDAEVDDLAGKGVEFERYPEIGEVDDRGIHTLEGQGRGVWFKDPDGNIISVGQFG